MRQQLIVASEAEDTAASDTFAQKVTEFLSLDDTVLFYGDLGAGKTYLIKKIVGFLGCDSDTSSPSFAIINQYFCTHDIYHIDLYRIKDRQEIINTGLEEILNAEAIIFIEWPQIIEQDITWPHYRINIETNEQLESWRKLSLYKVE
jgi:tRNA threonylcarbamoyladenosine biosynthesis protein TsaE